MDLILSLLNLNDFNSVSLTSRILRGVRDSYASNQLEIKATGMSKFANHKFYEVLYEVEENDKYDSPESLLFGLMSGNYAPQTIIVYVTRCGLLGLLKYLYHKKIDTNQRGYLNSVIQSNNLALLKYFVTHYDYHRPESDLLDFAIKKNNMKMLDYLINTLSISTRGLMNAIANHGDLNMMINLSAKYNLTPDDGTISNAIDKGKLDIIKYLIKDKGLTVKDYMKNYVPGNIETGEYIGTRFRQLSNSNIIHRLDVDSIQYIIDNHGFKLDPKSIDIIVIYNKLDLLKHFRSTFNIKPSLKDVTGTARIGNLNMLKYIKLSYGLDPIFDEYFITRDFKTMKYLMENYRFVPKTNMINDLVSRGHLKALKYIEKQYGIKPTGDQMKELNNISNLFK